MSRVLFILVPPGHEFPNDSLTKVSRVDIDQADLVIAVKAEAFDGATGRRFHGAKVFKTSMLDMGSAMVQKLQWGKVEPDFISPTGLDAAVEAFRMGEPGVIRELKATDSYPGERIAPDDPPDPEAYQPIRVTPEMERKAVEDVVRAYLSALG